MHMNLIVLLVAAQDAGAYDMLALSDLLKMCCLSGLRASSVSLQTPWCQRAFMHMQDPGAYGQLCTNFLC
jgi:hypothetical protein